MAQPEMIETIVDELQDADISVPAPDNLLIIEGVHENGAKFRPSDWPERLSSTFGVFGKDHRLHYDPAVYPRVSNGQKGLAVALSLQWKNPSMFKAVIKFARDNNLRIRDEQIVKD
ncbi:DUF3579 domain-containing protein [Kaarinaea lacus]